MNEPTVQELNADLIHDSYCPDSDACKDPKCGYRPVTRRVVIVAKRVGKRLEILHQAEKPDPGSMRFLTPGEAPPARKTMQSLEKYRNLP